MWIPVNSSHGILSLPRAEDVEAILVGTAPTVYDPAGQ